MRGANEYTTLRVSREDSYTKMSLKRLSSHKTANLSNKARAFSIASLVHKGRYLSLSFVTANHRGVIRVEIAKLYFALLRRTRGKI